MDDHPLGDVVNWRGQTYVAHPYPDVPEYRYLTDLNGARFVVPASEVVQADLRDFIRWVWAMSANNSK